MVVYEVRETEVFEQLLRQERERHLILFEKRHRWLGWVVGVHEQDTPVRRYRATKVRNANILYGTPCYPPVIVHI